MAADAMGSHNCSFPKVLLWFPTEVTSVTTVLLEKSFFLITGVQEREAATCPEKLGLETIPKLFLFKIFARNAHFDHVFIGCRRCSSFQDHLHCNLDCTALNLHLYPARFKMGTFYPIAQKFLQFNEILSFSKQNMFSFATKNCRAWILISLQLGKNSLAHEMRRRANERVSVRQGYT
jgi:hypothetical protein